MAERTSLLLLLGLPLVIALPFGVLFTALGLIESGSLRFVTGLSLLAVGILGVECWHWLTDVIAGEARAGRCDLRLARDVRVQERMVLGCLQFGTLLLAALLLDGHVVFRTCGYVYLVYAVAAAGVLARRRAAGAWGGRFLRWGWTPVLAFGVPAALPVLRAAGLIRLVAVGLWL